MRGEAGIRLVLAGLTNLAPWVGDESILDVHYVVRPGRMSLLVFFG